MQSSSKGNSTVKGFIELLSAQRQQIKKILADLTDDEINWNPQTKSNSIGNLIEHITASEAFLFQEKVLGTKTHRVREKEFEYRYRARKELLTAYEYMEKATQSLESKITDEDLFKKTVDIHGGPKTWFWILGHVLEHNYYHIGQANYISGLLHGEKFLDRPRKKTP